MEYGRSCNDFDFIPPSAALKPVSYYGSTKAAFYQLISTLSLNNKDLKIIYNRIFNVYGEGQFKNNLWPSLKFAALNNNDFSLSPGKQIRDFISVEAVAKEFLYDCNFNLNIENNLLVKNIGSGLEITIEDFAKKWWSHWNGNGKLLVGDSKYRDNEIMRCVPKLG